MTYEQCKTLECQNLKVALRTALVTNAVDIEQIDNIISECYRLAFSNYTLDKEEPA